VQKGRARKRALFVKYPGAFYDRLSFEIARMERRAKRAGLRAVVRLNGTTDIAWPAWIMEKHPRVQFYDYTKHAPRMIEPRPANYDLTYSRSENRDAAARAVLANGGRVAVVFSTKRGAKLPYRWEGFRVVDGDSHDLRFKNGRNVVIGLRAKGRARYDQAGFVVRA
jgi:hypothetical protein